MTPRAHLAIPRAATRARGDAPPPPGLAGHGWAARLELAFERRMHGCVLAHVRHEGPLTVQRALHPEGRDVCHVVVVHPPGGVAGGDTLDVDVDVRAGAHAVLTMPGAAKFHRSDGRTSRQAVRIRAGAGAIVEWLPPETIVFDGAIASAVLEIDLADEATAIGWDVLALGRRARGEAFRDGRWRQRLAIRRAGRLLAEDTLDLAGGDAWMRSRAGLAGAPVCATLFAAGRAVDAAVVAGCREANRATRAAIGVTMPLPGLVMARCLASGVEEARDAFVAMWSRLRPALAGLDARPLRLWAT
ncbi:Urease accessory protein UreD [Burkholderiales bacterium]|nr:Urease accessory protein UreD [Burkholderiales bacterium]